MPQNTLYHYFSLSIKNSDILNLYLIAFCPQLIRFTMLKNLLKSLIMSRQRIQTLPETIRKYQTIHLK